ncbi:tail fiber protein [Pseudomonas sp. NPDC086251]|uniref:tail fiber protein n=1 Tax=Pseudomonas sp. NPDC086251 TaxID=3364431 RepID=UPI003835A39D
MTKKKVPERTDKNALAKAASAVNAETPALLETTATTISDDTSIGKAIIPTEVSSTTRQNTTFAQGNSVGPTTVSLKEKFSAQKIPLQTDFADLIDVADCGRNAVGLNPTQPGGTGAGLLLDQDARLAVVPGAGMAVDATGVRIADTQMLVTGMIMMFSGQVAPAGWAFCDGSQGTPNLTNRFILGGTPTECGNPNGAMQQLTPLNNKQFYPTVSSTTPPITMNNAATVLTVAMMPQHYHNGGVRLDNYAYNWANEICEYGITGVGTKGCMAHTSTITVNAATPNTSSAGSNAPHSHANTASQAAHSHNVNIVPPYYILAFIIKL